MGNKSGKFNVPATTPVNKDDAVINETEVKVEEIQNGDANGEHITPETQNGDSNSPDEAPKKKSVMSWLKKVSIRKEKKPKSPKENGVKDDLAETPKENGDVEEVKQIDENVAVEEVVANGHKEHSEEEAELKTEAVEKVEETPMANGHENGVESSESPVEEH